MDGDQVRYQIADQHRQQVLLHAARNLLFQQSGFAKQQRKAVALPPARGPVLLGGGAVAVGDAVAAGDFSATCRKRGTWSFRSESLIGIALSSGSRRTASSQCRVMGPTFSETISANLLVG